jgi:hypothetical protein
MTPDEDLSSSSRLPDVAERNDQAAFFEEY